MELDLNILLRLLVGLERYLLATAAAVLVFCVLHIVAYVKPADTKKDKGTE